MLISIFNSRIITHYSLVLISSVILLQGCSHVPPRVEDVTSKTAVAIVKKILCETGGAIKSNVDNRFYDDAIVVSTVDFTITENNDNSSKLSLSIPIITDDTLTIEFGGKYNLTRKGDRQISTTNTFSELKILSGNGCNDNIEGSSNSYPILGSIGVDEVINSFISLAQHDPNVRYGHKFIETYKDVVTFTTEIEDSLTPKVVINKATGEKLTADFGRTNNRTDIHKLTIFITPPEIGSIKENRKALKKYNSTLEKQEKALEKVNDMLNEPLTPIDRYKMEETKLSLQDAIKELKEKIYKLTNRIISMEKKKEQPIGLTVDALAESIKALSATEIQEPYRAETFNEQKRKAMEMKNVLEEAKQALEEVEDIYLDKVLDDKKQRAFEDFERNRSGNILDKVIEEQLEINQ